MAGGLIFTACKKEDVKKETIQNKNETTWDYAKKHDKWIVSKEIVYIDSIPCLVYKNEINGQLIYEVTENESLKAQSGFDFDSQLFRNDNGIGYKCELSGEECCNSTFHDVDVIIVRPCLNKNEIINNKVNLNDGSWKLINSHFKIKNIDCQVYENIYSNQKLYLPSETKSTDDGTRIKYDKKLDICGDNHYSCEAAGNECANITYGGTPYIIVNPGTRNN